MEFVKLVGPMGIFFIMFTLGLKLSFEDFSNILKKPSNLIIGLSCQMIILPLIGVLMILVYPMPFELRIGLFLLLLLPSAALSNYATKLVNGNIPLSITITCSASLLCFITIPLFLNILLSVISENTSFYIDVKKLSITIFSIITIPTIFGIFINRYVLEIKKRLLIFLDKICLLIFLVIISIAIYQEKSNLGDYFEYTGVVVPITILLVLASSIIICKFLVKDISNQRAIIIECLLQNGAMGFIIGAQIFDEIVYVTPIAVYALIQYFVLLFYIANIQIKK